MVRSMTGYGRVQESVDGLNILFEIKSVNHRFFEFNARIPRVYGFIEDKLKSYLQNYISRGKVDVFMTIDSVDGGDSKVKLNYGIAESYIEALKELHSKYNLVDDISVSTVARYSDIFTVIKPPDDEERIWKAVKTVVDKAVEGFIAMRTAEGERLKTDIVARAQKVSELVDAVEKRSPETVDEYRNKLTARMAELLADKSIDENRILLEAAIYADKVSVTEETVRLKSHLKQFETMLGGNEPVGRKLDFLMQEMNREANTIGSKASDIEIAKVVVDIKAELEKIREQIQNLE
ncbi:MAG TPA: YicC/YloC family endoribonuclease [Ruminiclostridium sp.]|nr:YicC/YloC family endoribonuclease [Ruminiclostridium sp.]